MLTPSLLSVPLLVLLIHIFSSLLPTLHPNVKSACTNGRMLVNEKNITNNEILDTIDVILDVHQLPKTPAYRSLFLLIIWAHCLQGQKNKHDNALVISKNAIDTCTLTAQRLQKNHTPPDQHIKKRRCYFIFLFLLLSAGAICYVVSKLIKRQNAQEPMAALTNQTALQTNDLELLTNHVSSVNHRLTEQTNQLTNLTNRHNTMQTNIAALTHQIVGQQQEGTALQANLELLANNISSVNHRLTEQTNQLAHLTNQCNTMQTNMATLTNHIANTYDIQVEQNDYIQNNNQLVSLINLVRGASQADIETLAPINPQSHTSFYQQH